MQHRKPIQHLARLFCVEKREQGCHNVPRSDRRRLRNRGWLTRAGKISTRGLQLLAEEKARIIVSLEDRMAAMMKHADDFSVVVPIIPNADYSTQRALELLQ